MKDSDLTKLIGGPYWPPRLRIGDIATCLYRDCEVVITSWSDGRISWPRCRSRDSHGGSGLLIDETLVQAIKTESAEAIKFWFGAAHNTIWKWRRTFGIGQRDTPGSLRLYEATAQKAGDATRRKRFSATAVRAARKRAIDLNLVQYLHDFRDAHRRPWSERDAALLGTMPDTRLARQLGCTRDAVRGERERRQIPCYRKPPSPESLLSPEKRETLRRERIAAAKRGKKRPPHVIEAMVRARTGRKASAQ